MMINENLDAKGESEARKQIEEQARRQKPGLREAVSEEESH